MKVGTRVKWTSQSQGHTKTKTGRIVAVVPPGSRPSQSDFPQLYRNSGCGFGRRRESYVVKADPPNYGVYWPHEGKLEIDDTTKEG